MSGEGPELARNEDFRAVGRDFYREIFERHPHPAWVYDTASLVFLAVNQSAITEYGYSKSEFLSMKVPEICAADDCEAGLALAADPNSREPIPQPEHRRKNGSLFCVTAFAYDIALSDRRARLVLINDISERTRMERDLRLFAAALAGASDAIMITDADWRPGGPRIVYVNSAFTAVTGFSSDDAVGQGPWILHGPKTEIISRTRIMEDLEISGVARYESLNYRKNGAHFTCDWHVSPVRDESGEVTHYLSIQHDVTERNRLQEQFQQAQKMDAVGRLAGGIAHDFNNLLTIILGYAGLLSVDLLRAGDPADKQFRSLSEIQKAAEKAAALTSQLLAFSRKQVLRTRVISLNPVISNLESMLRRLIGEDIDLDLSLDPALARVEADPGQVEQVLMNLAANARDAMPRGGMLTIETKTVEITTRSAPIIPLEPGQYVLLVMTDTGQGMDEETRSRVFEPFFTTKDPGRGTGLGLAMVYGFVKQSGGWISVSSEPGHGACFKLYLPSTDSHAEIEFERKAPVMARGAGGTILVVEDEIGIRELVREVLTDAGYFVLTASNADDAIRAVEKHFAPVDLLLTDVVLPGASGPDLADRLKALQPRVRVLFASGYSDHALLRQGAIARNAAFIQKPFDTDTLLEEIGRLMDSGSSSKQAS